MQNSDPGASSVLGFLSDGGDMGALMRAHDWSATSIGSPESGPRR